MIAYELSRHGQELVRLIEEARDSGDADLEASLTALRDAMLAEDEGVVPADFLLARKRDWLELEARAAGARMLRDRMAREIRALDRAAEASHEIALMYMQARGIKVQETDDPEVGVVRRQGNGGVQPVKIKEGVEPGAVPSRFVVPKTEFDLGAIREALMAGEALPWARLEERGEHVR